ETPLLSDKSYRVTYMDSPNPNGSHNNNFETPTLPFPRNNYDKVKSNIYYYYHKLLHLTCSQLIFASLIILLTLSNTGELISRKILATNLYNYRWFLVQFILIITWLVSFILVIINLT